MRTRPPMFGLVPTWVIGSFAHQIFALWFVLDSCPGTCSKTSGLHPRAGAFEWSMKRKKRNIEFLQRLVLTWKWPDYRKRSSKCHLFGICWSEEAGNLAVAPSHAMGLRRKSNLLAQNSRMPFPTMAGMG